MRPNSEWRQFPQLGVALTNSATAQLEETLRNMFSVMDIQSTHKSNVFTFYDFPATSPQIMKSTVKVLNMSVSEFQSDMWTHDNSL